MVTVLDCQTTLVIIVEELYQTIETHPYCTNLQFEYLVISIRNSCMQICHHIKNYTVIVEQFY